MLGKLNLICKNKRNPDKIEPNSKVGSQQPQQVQRNWFEETRYNRPRTGNVLSHMQPNPQYVQYHSERPSFNPLQLLNPWQMGSYHTPGGQGVSQGHSGFAEHKLIHGSKTSSPAIYEPGSLGLQGNQRPVHTPSGTDTMHNQDLTQCTDASSG